MWEDGDNITQQTTDNNTQQPNNNNNNSTQPNRSTPLLEDRSTLHPPGTLQQLPWIAGRSTPWVTAAENRTGPPPPGSRRETMSAEQLSTPRGVSRGDGRPGPSRPYIMERRLVMPSATAMTVLTTSVQLPRSTPGNRHINTADKTLQGTRSSHHTHTHTTFTEQQGDAIFRLLRNTIKVVLFYDSS